MLEHTIERDHPTCSLCDNSDGQETEGTLSAEMRRLEALPADTSPMPDRMKASDLAETELFQVRAGIFTAHVESLCRALAHEGDLQPLLVLRRGGQAFLIDGRHRKRAYEQAGRGDSVPVVEFQGTPQEALLEGQRVNKLHTLAMTKDERMDCAWKLVKLDASGACRYTLKQIAAAGVSERQVTFMRRVLRELDDGFEHVRWKTAQRAHSKAPGREYTDDEIEEMMEAEATALADRMVRVFGTRYADRPEILARAIERYAGRRTQELARILAERSGDDGRDGEDEFFDF